MKEDIKSIEIPLDNYKYKKINENAIKLMEGFFKNEYIVELTKSMEDETPILRITKKE